MLGEDARLLYRQLVQAPGLGLGALADRADLSIEDATAAWAALRQAGLGVEHEDGGLSAVAPQVSFVDAIAETERQALLARERADAGRAEAAALMADYTLHQAHETIVELPTVAAVRERLVRLNEEVQTTCCSFTPSRSIPVDMREASAPLNEEALARGVALRCIYPDSMRHDSYTVGYARWLAERGSSLRTVPVVPMQMVLVDSKVALVPIDPEDPSLGALEIRTPGVVAALVALFESVWTSATDFEETAIPNDHGLTPQEAETVRLLSAGYTDEAMARQLQVSVRTLRRLVADLSERAAAHSRFEFGVKAHERGWV